MRKIKLLLNEKNSNKSNQFNKLISQASQHLNLQDFWRAATPKKLSDASFVGRLNNGELSIYTNSAAVATKIKLISGSLLTQLQNLQKEDPHYKEYQVTGIRVKVQVKSQQKRATIEPKRISSDAAATLKKLTNKLGDTALAKQLNKLAKKT
jgi:hypothetical protein